ncbi:MAG: hypothetical protein EXR93_04440 [Gemmatimonadetes bacterium]|nr:hypothetical protein [Gemmatimonadota bacterium]
MKRLMFATSALFVIALVAGCAPSRTAQPGVQPERKVVRMSRNIIGGYRPAFGNMVLNVETTIEGPARRYELFARWTGDARVDVSPGESLVVEADGQEFKFRVPESGIYRDFSCEPRCIYDDRAYYSATAAHVQAIANAKRVVVRLVGSKRTVEREFNELNFERFREFVQKNVPADSSVGSGGGSPPARN